MCKYIHIYIQIYIYIYIQNNFKHIHTCMCRYIEARAHEIVGANTYEFRTSRTFSHSTYCNTLQHTATHCNTLQHTATHCNTLHHTATHCNTLQHTATHLIRSRERTRLSARSTHKIRLEITRHLKRARKIRDHRRDRHRYSQTHGPYQFVHS